MSYAYGTPLIELRIALEEANQRTQDLKKNEKKRGTNKIGFNIQFHVHWFRLGVVSHLKKLYVHRSPEWAGMATYIKFKLDGDSAP
jgi:hypothetical protein